MAREIQSEIMIEGEKLAHFTSITINQLFNNHHRFEIIVSQEVLERQGTHAIEKSQKLIGKSITISFGEKNTSDNIFKGVITEIGMQQDQGLWGSILLKGFSPTYLLEGGYHYASYYKKTLPGILAKLTNELPPHDMQLVIAPKNTKEIAYITQYKESNFAFMNRLSAEYGEWFYYNGEKLFFGKPAAQPTIELLYGATVENMFFSMCVVPTNVLHYSYNSENDQVNQSMSPDQVESSNNYVQHVLKVSDKLYQQKVSQPAEIRTADKKRLDEYAKLQKGTKAAGTIKLTAKGDNPKVKLGSYIIVKIVQKEIQSEDTPEHGEYIVTSITHRLSGIGEYTHTFEAIPSDNNYIPVKAERPVAETQMAIVKDNSDPQKMGRIRVQMLWQKEGDLTDWIRVLTPDAGSSDKVSKNRGFVFIPEVGDQVLLGFRYNDPNRPFVLGSMFHGKIAEGGGDTNKTKSMATRSGNKLELNDDKGSVFLTDKGGANMHFDGAGNAKTIANTSKTIDVGEGKAKMNMDNNGNITLNADKNLKITVGSSSFEMKMDGTILINGKLIGIGGSDGVGISSKKEIDISAAKNHIGGETKMDGGNVFIN